MSGAPVQVEVSVDRCPPSLNDVAGQGTRYRWIAAKKLWYRDLAPALAAAGMVRCDTVYVEGLITFPNRRKRDQGNYRAPLEKFLGDALQRGGYLPDDDWAHYQFGDLQAGYEKGVSRTQLVLFCSGCRPISPVSTTAAGPRISDVRPHQSRSYACLTLSGSTTRCR